MRVVGRSEQQAIDRLWTERTGLPLLLLMEQAAAAVSRIIRQLLETSGHSDATVLILAGKGHNGGDAFACARQLNAEGINVVCRELFPAKELPLEAAANRQSVRASGLSLGQPKPEDFTDLKPGSIIVDGIFGTGFRAGQLPPMVIDTIHQVAAARQKGAIVVAIDVPTGLDADTGAILPDCIHADYTVTFIRNKIGLCAAPGRYVAGHVIIDSIGVPDAWIEESIEQVLQTTGRLDIRQLTPEHMKACSPSRPGDSHKGMFGKALLLGGSPGMPGAIMLAAEAALRSGVGIVTLAVPESIGPLMLAARPESLLHLMPEQTTADPNEQLILAEETASLISTLIDSQTTVAAGPGAGPAAWLRRALPQIIRQATRLVLDADALNLIAADPEKFFPLLRGRTAAGLEPAILTPHPGECRRLGPDLDLKDRQLAARKLAERCGCIIVLKGASTVIASHEGPIWINPTGNTGLARGGSGDVLCGLIAGLLAQEMTPFNAALSGVYLHGLAADLAAGRLGRRAMLPRDVIAAFGDAFRTAGWEND